MRRTVVTMCRLLALLALGGVVWAQEAAYLEERPEMEGLMMRGRMFMGAQIAPTDPAALLALKDELKLTGSQVDLIEAMGEKTRRDAWDLLTQDQQTELMRMRGTPRTMGEMHEHMMSRMRGGMMGGMMRGRMMQKGRQEESKAPEAQEGKPEMMEQAGGGCAMMKMLMEQPGNEGLKMRAKMMLRAHLVPSDPDALLALAEEIKLTPEQVKGLQALVEKARAGDELILTDAQKKQLEVLKGTPDTMMALHKEVMAKLRAEMKMMGLEPDELLASREELKLTPDQVAKLEQIAKRAQADAEAILTPEQKKQAQETSAPPMMMMEMRRHMMSMMRGGMGGCPMMEMMQEEKGK